MYVTYVYKTLNTNTGEKHRSCREVFYLALLLLPREKIWALAMKCLMSTLQFSLLQMAFGTLQRCTGTLQWPGARIPTVKKHLE